MSQIDELLTRGVDKIYPSKEDLEKRLEKGEKLTLYQGFDPTGTKLHIGHMVGLKKLSQWQKLGHRVILVIGDGTGQAGDPSGKTTAREKFFTNEELRENAKEYLLQAKKILDFEGENPVEVKYNGDWLNKLTLTEVLEILSHFSAQQLIERDLFQERIKNGQDINLREFFYPILQAYDSVALQVDLELGGSDQTFNMLFGRKLVKEVLGKEKFVMTTPLLQDSDGRKIGKTEGNVIALDDKPEDLYRKIMALGDDVIVNSFEWLTNISEDEIGKIKDELSSGTNPKDLKKRLAYEITKDLNTDSDAKKAQEEFERVVENKELPSNLESIEITKDRLVDEDLLVELDLANSRSDAKRLFQQGGVKLDGQRIELGQALLDEEGEGLVLSVGKKMLSIKVN